MSSRKWIVVEGVAILIIALFSFFTAGYAMELVSGVLEPEWSYEGVTFSNHNVMMIFLYGLSAGGIAWITGRKIKKKNAANMVGIIVALWAALLMACSPIFYATIPLVVLLLVIGVVLMDKKRKYRESSCNISSTPSC